MNIASLWRLANRPPFDKGEVSSLCGQKRFFYDPLASNGGVWADWLLKAEKILLNLASNYRYRVFVQSELEWNEDIAYSREVQIVFWQDIRGFRCSR